MLLNILGWVVLVFLGVSFFPTLFDVFRKYRLFQTDGTFKAGARGKHGLTKENYVWKAGVLLTIQLVIIIVLIYYLVIK